MNRIILIFLAAMLTAFPNIANAQGSQTLDKAFNIYSYGILLKYPLGYFKTTKISKEQVLKSLENSRGEFVVTSVNESSITAERPDRAALLNIGGENTTIYTSFSEGEIKTCLYHFKYKTAGDAKEAFKVLRNNLREYGKEQYGSTSSNISADINDEGHKAVISLHRHKKNVYVTVIYK